MASTTVWCLRQAAVEVSLPRPTNRWGHDSCKYGPIQHALPEESTLPKTRKAKKSVDRHIERSTSFRLGHNVLKAADVMARVESAARGIKVSRADIIREAVMERYRRRKVKQKG
jgi:hypothetical protein